MDLLHPADRLTPLYRLVMALLLADEELMIKLEECINACFNTTHLHGGP